MLSVSRLCCPVCWKLLAILSENEPLQFCLRGSHTTISPIELPRWIPNDVVSKMIEHFQKSLLQEIEIMLKAARADQGANTIRQGRHATHMSESNISVASTTNYTPRHVGFTRRDEDSEDSE
jgi:hypothetical protein